ncbi:hypothetical protein QTP88_003516 [Uroleucon formosanum]
MLSSTSNSRLHEGKKTKTFISPNRFAVLASDVTGDDPVFDTAPSFRDDTVVSSPHTMDHRTEPPAPPLYIRNIINFSAFKNVLIKTVGLDGFTCKSTPSYLIVRPNGRDNFNALANYLMDTNASFHTFRPPVDRLLGSTELATIPHFIKVLTTIGYIYPPLNNSSVVFPEKTI